MQAVEITHALAAIDFSDWTVSLLETTIFGTTSIRVMRHASCPVFTVVRAHAETCPHDHLSRCDSRPQRFCCGRAFFDTARVAALFQFSERPVNWVDRKARMPKR